MISETVGDAVDFIRGITFKPNQLAALDDPSAIVCMRTKNVQRDLDESDLIAVPEELVRDAKKELRSGDILISSANSWELVGKVSYVGELGYRATAGGFIGVVRPKSHTNSRFLCRWLNSPKSQHLLRHCGRQTTNISNLSVPRFKELKFPKIENGEQRRIAAILDKAGAIRRKQEQALDLTEEFLKSVFLEMFSDPLTNPGDLPTELLSTFGEIVTGITPPRSNSRNYDTRPGRPLRWLRRGCMKGFLAGPTKGACRPFMPRHGLNARNWLKPSMTTACGNLADASCFWVTRRCYGPSFARGLGPGCTIGRTVGRVSGQQCVLVREG